ncbi:MAG TPA: hypothetical protein PKW33_10800 [Anaerolineaceae bacterium]|nr:hypothetical protein [Anaerolineaceae bacterium]HPN52066.1 hypothetical protein [Anaerolineaceae bacterium]
MRTIRASEIGSFIYCQRAWWYQRQGIESSNQAELSMGSEMHAQHGRQVFVAGLLRVAGVALLLITLALAAAGITSLLLQ